MAFVWDGEAALQLENVELNSNLLNSRPNTTHRYVLAFHATFKTIMFISSKVSYGYSDLPLIARPWVEIGGEVKNNVSNKQKSKFGMDLNDKDADCPIKTKSMLIRNAGEFFEHLNNFYTSVEYLTRANREKKDETSVFLA